MSAHNHLLTGKLREAQAALKHSLDLLDALGLCHEAALVSEACERIDVAFTRATRAGGE